MKKTQNQTAVKKDRTVLVQLSEKDLAQVAGGRRIIVYGTSSGDK
ncbi:MAG TPA: hypothetical protein VIL09_19155 [Microvirga sp.]|jgi:bacteriocin-like protein